MKEDICSIPVNEVLAVKDGCPICRMRQTLEEHMLEFIMGAAMMEPDVREQTNRRGFCGRHSLLMLGRKNRLGLALMLESRLKEVQGSLADKGGLLRRKSPEEQAAEALGGCYVCERIDTALDALLVTFFRLWKKEEEFRQDVAAQPLFCLPHYELLLREGRRHLDKKGFPAFEQALSQVMRTGLDSLLTDVTGFCRMFDYRSSGEEWGTRRDAPDRAVAFLTGFQNKP